MGPQTQKLSVNLSKLEEILARHGEQEWAARVHKSNDEIERGDFAGVERFLGMVGGMGSLNDVVFMDADATDELHRIMSEAFDLANSINRQQ